jgi:hypothetical protein
MNTELLIELIKQKRAAYMQRFPFITICELQQGQLATHTEERNGKTLVFHCAEFHINFVEQATITEEEAANKFIQKELEYLLNMLKYDLQLALTGKLVVFVRPSATQVVPINSDPSRLMLEESFGALLL